MRINRVELLQKLEAVKAGVAKREMIEQSSCFVFKDGLVQSFNDEIYCSAPIDLGFEGAVAAEKVVVHVGKMPEDEIEIWAADGKLQVKGAGRGAWWDLEEEVLLPVDQVEPPGDWQPVDPEFLEGMALVNGCAAGTDAYGFNLTCVHLSPRGVEACDNFQAARYPCPTGVAADALVRAATTKAIGGFDMTEMSETPNWLHFRNTVGLLMSCRKMIDQYPNITGQFAKREGETPLALPKGLTEAVARAEDFVKEHPENPQVLIELRPGKCKITGEGVTGGSWEVREISYDGEPFKFRIAPKLLGEICAKHNACTITPGRLRVAGGKFVYVSCLGKVE